MYIKMYVCALEPKTFRALSIRGAQVRAADPSTTFCGIKSLNGSSISALGELHANEKEEGRKEGRKRIVKGKDMDV
jgi:hypothetical protein